MNKRMLIIGSSGFIGRNLLRILHGSESFAVSTLNRRSEPSLWADAGTTIEWRYEQIRESVTTAAPDVIVHLAEARSHTADVSGMKSTIEQNVLPAVAIIEAAQSCGTRPRIIYLDSGLSYGDNASPYVESMQPRPMNAYALGKLYVASLLQMAARMGNISYTILRASVVYGPEQDPDMFIPALITRLLTGKPMEMTAGDQTRDFLFVEDLIRAIVLSASSDKCCDEILNVGSGRSVAIRDVAFMIAQVLGKGRESLLLGRKQRHEHEPVDYRFDISKIKRLLGWTPAIDLHAGIERTVEWFRKQAT
jgi:UDP-glucose 4-epimerase